MKKLFSGIIAAVIVITGIFTFAGCEKEEATEKQSPTLSSAFDSLQWENFFASSEWENLLANVLQNQHTELPNYTYISISIIDFTIITETVINTDPHAPCNDGELQNCTGEYETPDIACCSSKIKTKNVNKLKKWIERQAMKGNKVNIDFVDGYWIGTAVYPSENAYHDDWQR